MIQSSIEKVQPEPKLNSEQKADLLPSAQVSANAPVSSIDFWVECNVCKQRYKNWTGSTPCCGSIAWIIENGQPTKRIPLFASINFGPTQIVTIDGND